MKKRIWLAGLAAAVVLAGTSLAVYADEAQSPSGDNDRPAMGGCGMGCGRMDGGRMGMMKGKLGLSDDQAAKLKELFKKQMEETRPLRDQMGVEMATLRQKVDQKAPDSELKRLLDKLSQERQALQTDRQKLVDSLREVLTPTQQAKMLLGMRGRGMAAKCGMGGEWKGHPGWKMGKGKKMDPPGNGAKNDPDADSTAGGN